MIPEYLIKERKKNDLILIGLLAATLFFVGFVFFL